MQINFTGHHIEVTDALREYATERLTRLARHLPNLMSVNVTLTVEKLRQIAEAHLHAPGAELHASSESEDMYSAIDLLYDKLKRIVDKHKGKMTEHHGQKE